MTQGRRGGSLLTELGTAVGCGVIAALVGSGPAALRLAGDGDGRAWLVLAACATPVTVLAVLLFREAYAGLGALLGAQADGRGAGGRDGRDGRYGRGTARVFVSAWFVLLAPVLFSLGAVLRATTNHRALGGVTFAILALGAAVACGAVAGRLASVVESQRDRRPGVHTMLAGLVYSAAVGLLFAGTYMLHTKLPAESAATMLDVTALGLASALAGRPEFRGGRPLAILGPLAAVALVGLGVSRGSPEIVSTVAARAPAFGVLVEPLRGEPESHPAR